MSDASTIELTPAFIVIFGITGDLAVRKLLPALYELQKNNLLHTETRIIGITRHQQTVDDVLKKAEPSILSRDGRLNNEIIAALHDRMELFSMQSALVDDYPSLGQHLDSLEDEAGLCINRLFYLAVPPQISMSIISHLGESGLRNGCHSHGNAACLLLEKPFGFDCTTAQELIDATTAYFHEDQIFRIDHYLAKETVQNMVTFRFRNPLFEDIWDNKHIESIDIAAHEKIDIEGRANFYESVGALRDLIQSHLLHIMSVVMMDRPGDIPDANAMHDARLKVLEHIEPVPADKIDQRVVRGQYEGYKTEADSPKSEIETFVALKLFSRDPDWSNVPIYLTTGKAMESKYTRITICFKAKHSDQDHTNQLIFYIQPNESIVVKLWIKKPGFKRELQTAPMSFSYDQLFNAHGHPDAYERVLIDAIRGDNSLFATSDEVMAAWRILQPVIDNWSKSDKGLVSYKKDSSGPDLSTLQ
jgi:glucose-6-phosphate 1-dehydrogenase